MSSSKTPPPSFHPEFSPLSLLRTLWKRKWSILAVWCLVTMAVIAVIWHLPAVYNAEALILVDSQKIPEKYVSATISTDLQDRLATISQQILSSTRLKKIIEDFGLYQEERKIRFEEEVLEMMRKDISIRLERTWTGNRPGAFRIGYQGHDPALVARVANRLTNLYIEENLKSREVQAEGTSEFLETQLQAAKKRLDELEARVSEYKLRHNGELPQQEASLIGALARLQVELEANRDAVNRTQQTKTLLENTFSLTEAALAAQTHSVEPPPSAPDAAAAPGGAPPVVKKRSDTLLGQLELLRQRYSEDHPDIRRMKGDLETVRRLEEKESSETAAAAAAQALGEPARLAPARPAGPGLAERAELSRVRERASSLRAQLQLAGEELEHRMAEQQRILHDITAYQARIDRLPVREQEMSQITRDYEISKANYKSLLDKKLSAEMATDMERRQKSERFTVLDPARPAEKPIKPNRPLFALLGTIFALALAVILGLARELRHDVILGEWELPPNTTVLARLPYIEIPADATAEMSA